MSLPADLLARLLHHLNHRGPRTLLRLAERLPAHLTEVAEVREQLSYFSKRVAQMQYPHFRQQGWPIGSGSVESANKLVVQARLKGAGMHWHRHNVNPLLALRNGVCNERWLETWQTGHQHLEEQQQQRRTLRAQQRREKALALCDPHLLTSPPLPPVPVSPPPPSSASSPAAPAATLPGSCRPSAHHPWKRAPACRPKLSAKN